MAGTEFRAVPREGSGAVPTGGVQVSPCIHVNLCPFFLLSSLLLGKGLCGMLHVLPRLIAEQMSKLSAAHR